MSGGTGREFVQTSSASLLFTDNTEASLNDIPLERDERLALFEVMALVCILALIIIGNTFCISLICYRKRQNKRISFFILNMCIADILVAFLNVVPQLAWKITYEWKGGYILCKLVKYGQVFSMYLSTYVLLATALDRYIAICKPLLMNFRTFRSAKYSIFTVWIISIFCALPQLFVFDIKAVEKSGGRLTNFGNMLFSNGTDIWNDSVHINKNHYSSIVPSNQYQYHCWAIHHFKWGDTAYMSWFLVAIYILPLVLLIYFYTSICLTILCTIRSRNVHIRKRSKDITLPATTTIGEEKNEKGEDKIRKRTISWDFDARTHHPKVQRRSMFTTNTSKNKGIPRPSEGTNLSDTKCVDDSKLTGKCLNRFDPTYTNRRRERRYKSATLITFCPNKQGSNEGKATQTFLYQRESDIHVSNPPTDPKDPRSRHKVSTFSTKFNKTPPIRAHSFSIHSISRAKVKTIQLTLCVVICYILCWSPFFISIFYLSIMNDPANINQSMVICALLGNLTSCFNPWIYISFNCNLIKNLHTAYSTTRRNNTSFSSIFVSKKHSQSSNTTRSKLIKYQKCIR